MGGFYFFFMGKTRSIRSQRGKAKRAARREKLSQWEAAKIDRFSKALQNSDMVVVETDGQEVQITNEDKMEIAKDIQSSAQEEMSTNKLIHQTGIPKRKKRKAQYFANRKKQKRKGKKTSKIKK